MIKEISQKNKMMLVDVHAHLELVNDLDNAIDRAKKAGVKAVITAGVNPETNKKALELSEKYEIVRPALGIYPMDALSREINKPNLFDADEEIDFIRENKSKIAAIGEVGLDYKNGKNKQQQKEVFTKMIKLAIEIDKPLIVHSRAAENDAVEILEKFDFKKIIMHCFNGNKGLVKRIIKNNWFFSIPCNVVKSFQLQYIVIEASISKLLTETDAPFLSPFAGKQNEPAFVKEAIKKIAEIKGLNTEETSNIIFMNYKSLFE